MLAISNYTQKGIFERVVRAKNGALMRVRFEVYELQGELKGKVLAIEPIVSINGSAAENKYLSCACNLLCAKTQYISPFKSIVSPYIELYFFTSQPTRAPSFR